MDWYICTDLPNKLTSEASYKLKWCCTVIVVGETKGLWYSYGQPKFYDVRIIQILNLQFNVALSVGFSGQFSYQNV